jgi:iron complex outermembrane receptor protein
MHISIKRSLMGAAATLALAFATAAAADGAAVDSAATPPPASPGTVAGNGSEGTSVDELIVTTTAQSQAAAAAPVKANLNETEPQSIISGKFIHDFTQETGDYTTILLIAPSVAGINTNGGFSNTNTITLRGFQDGQYNITYDGISFGDTNDPTHHPSDYFPTSTIGAAVIDRGPGAAGDLGQANYGGAVHLFSPTVSDTFNIDQRLTYGTWDTFESVSAVQSGAIAQTGGTKVLALFDYRSSDTELSYSDAMAYNYLLKVVQPINDHSSITFFSTMEYTRYYTSDANSGESIQQVLAYGKNFSLSNDPTSELYYKDNEIKKNTDFEYIDYRNDFGRGLTLEDQFYTYFYSNKTISADDNSGLLTGANTSAPKDKAYPDTDIGGYNKGNRYRVYGDILRVNDDFKWNWLSGTIKAGGLIEGSETDRHNILYDLTTGQPDYHYAQVAGPEFEGDNENVKTAENSSWVQYQLFADFVLRPTDNITLTPGIKYVDFRRTIEGSIENSVEGPTTRAYLSGSNTYTSPLYFFTANYKVLPFWSVYAQYATGFLIPSLSYLYSDALSLQNLKPATTTNYQVGTVFSKGHLAFDGDVYFIHGNNLEEACPGTNTDGAYCNIGTADYSGVEGEITYALPLGFTVFANASINTAKDRTTDMTELNAPKWTDAFGVIYDYHRWQGSISYKEVGDQVAYDIALNAALPNNMTEVEIGSYNTTNATVAYDFGHFKVKLSGFNLFDHRAITSATGPTPSDFVTFQSGRELLLTFEAKLR